MIPTNRMLTPSSSASILSALVERRGSKASANGDDEERQHLLDTEQSTSQLDTNSVSDPTLRRKESTSSSFGSGNTYGSIESMTGNATQTTPRYGNRLFVENILFFR
jgi:hypothetical protein